MKFINILLLLFSFYTLNPVISTFSSTLDSKNCDPNAIDRITTSATAKLANLSRSSLIYPRPDYLRKIEKQYAELFKQYKGRNGAHAHKNILNKMLKSLPRNKGTDDAILVQAQKIWGKNIIMKNPEVPSRSGAKVLMIYNQNNEFLGVVKVTNKEAELFDYLHAGSIIEERVQSSIIHPNIIDAHRGLNDDLILFIEPAHGRSLVGLFKDDELAFQKAFDQLANFLGTLNKETPKNPDALTIFLENKLVDLKKAREIITDSNYGKAIPKLLLESNVASDIQSKKLENLFAGMIADYEKLPFDKMSLGITQGDAHLGNFIFDSKKDRLAVIDFETLTYTAIDANTGVNNMMDDVGRLMISLWDEGVKHGYSIEKISELENDFLLKFSEVAHIDLKILKTQINFAKIKLLRYVLRPNGDPADAKKIKKLVELITGVDEQGNALSHSYRLLSN